MNLRASLGGLVAAFALLGCADDPSGPCQSPAGTYTVDVAYVQGDCDNEIVSALLSRYPRDVSLSGRMCGYYESSDSAQTDQCDIELETLGVATADGFTNGRMAVGVDCDSAYSCSAYFNVYWTRR